MRITHFPTPWDEHRSSRAGTLLYGFNQQLTDPLAFVFIFPKSPTWRTFEFGHPCVLLKGLKCAHILVQFIYDFVIYKL